MSSANEDLEYYRSQVPVDSKGVDRTLDTRDTNIHYRKIYAGLLEKSFSRLMKSELTATIINSEGQHTLSNPEISKRPNQAADYFLPFEDGYMKLSFVSSFEIKITYIDSANKISSRCMLL